jgi:hypothetical protein
MTDLIDHYTRSPHRHHLLDGTFEMIMGVSLLFFAAAIWLSIRATVSWPWLAAIYCGIALLWILSALGTRYVRRKLVYPRSGYLKMRKRPWRLALMAFSACLLSAALVLYVGKIMIKPAIVPLSLSFLIGMAFLIAGLSTCIRKFILYAVISVGIGLIIQFKHLGFRSGVLWYYWLMGAALLLAGILTLYRYMHETPEQNLEAD